MHGAFILGLPGAALSPRAISDLKFCTVSAGSEQRRVRASNSILCYGKISE
jgi:hypothetical protein